MGNFLENILENGQATEATLARLVGVFGEAGGEVVHELVKAVQELKSAAQAPAAQPAPATPEAPAEEAPAENNRAG